MRKVQKQVRSVSQAVVDRELRKFNMAAHQVYAFVDFIRSLPEGSLTVDCTTGKRIPSPKFDE